MSTAFWMSWYEPGTPCQVPTSSTRAPTGRVVAWVGEAVTPATSSHAVPSNAVPILNASRSPAIVFTTPSFLAVMPTRMRL